MKALFEVGEEVILQGDLGGECVVLEVLDDIQRKNAVTGVVSGGYCYLVSISHANGAPFCEEALKKKHTPGDSFESIMSSR